MGDPDCALAVLEKAAALIELSEDRSLHFAIKFNIVENFCQLERYSDAANLLPQVRELAVQQANELDLLRLVWLKSKVEAGNGYWQEAIKGLVEVVRGFSNREMPYDAALCALDLAVLRLKAEQPAEVRELANAMGWIFHGKGIDREASVALQLFWDAARQEAATVEMAQLVIATIEGARRSAPSPTRRRDRA